MWRFFFILAGILGSVSYAENRYAFEIEIDFDRLQNLSHLFDLDAIPVVTRSEIADAAVDTQAPAMSRRALDALPLPLQKQITVGLNLDTDMDTVQRRWERHWDSSSLPERKAVVPLNLLPAEYKVPILRDELDVAHARKKKLPTPPLRTDVDTSLLADTEWEKDGQRMELKDARPTTDREKLIAKWKRITTTANVTAAIKSPNPADPGANYHLNVSVPQPGRNLTDLMRVYNVRQMARLVSVGNAADAFKPSHRYTDDLTVRGNVRMKGRNFFEVRAHWQTLEAEIAELEILLALPQEEACRRLANEVQGLLTPELLAEISKHSPRAYYDVIALTEDIADPNQVKYRRNQPEVVARLGKSGGESRTHGKELISVFNKLYDRRGNKRYLTELAKQVHATLDEGGLKTLSQDAPPREFLAFIAGTAELAGAGAKYTAQSPEVVGEAWAAALAYPGRGRMSALLTAARSNPAIARYLEELAPADFKPLLKGNNGFASENDVSTIGRLFGQLTAGERAAREPAYLQALGEVAKEGGFRVVLHIGRAMIETLSRDKTIASAQQFQFLIDMANKNDILQRDLITAYHTKRSAISDYLAFLIEKNTVYWEPTARSWVESFRHAPEQYIQLDRWLNEMLHLDSNYCAYGTLAP